MDLKQHARNPNQPGNMGDICAIAAILDYLHLFSQSEAQLTGY